MGECGVEAGRFRGEPLVLELDESGSSAISQSAVQAQAGGGSQVQIVDQDAGSHSGGKSSATSLAVSRGTARATWLAASSSGSPAEVRVDPLGEWTT